METVRNKFYFDGTEMDIVQKNKIDLNDPQNLDKIKLNKQQHLVGLLKALFFTTIGILCFFMPMEFNGRPEVPFGAIYKTMMNAAGNVGLVVITAFIAANALLSFYGKFMAKKDTRIYKYFEHDSVFHPIIYTIGAIFTAIYTLHVVLSGFTGPEWLVGEATGGTVIPYIVIATAWIIPVGSFFVPFLVSYGGLDFFGTILEPFMRPVFKVPGKSAVDALASFVGSASMAILITSKLYKSNQYTAREAGVISTCFSAISVGFAVLIVSTAGLAEHFTKVYFSSLFIAFVITMIVVRIPPLSKLPDVYYDGKAQLEDDVKNDSRFEIAIFKKAVDRAARKGYLADNIFNEVWISMRDGFTVLIKVITLIAAIGTISLILAEYTPLFKWLGMAFVPLLKIFGIPNAVEIAPSLPVGIGESFLPVLLIADKVDTIAIGARYFVTALSLVQILFFAETIVVIVATGIPLNYRRLIICFIERTVIAIPILAIAMRILF